MIALLLATLATYRLAVLVTEEEGPWELATRLRNLHTADDWLGRGLRCPACVSFWLALPATALVLAVDATLPPVLWPLTWLAVAGAARWLWRIAP